MSDKILIVDDDREIRDVLRILLTSEHFAVAEAGSGEEALRYLEEHQGEVDLVILDVMMEGISGYHVCLRLREKWNVPVLFLTAKSKESDLTMGYSSGGDDYLVKPFSYPELLARVKGLMRRYQVYRGKPEQAREEAEWGGLRVSLTGNMVWLSDREVDLTDTEWRILRLLIQNQGKIFSMENLYESVWQETYFPSSSNTVMVHIRRLREKIETDPRHPEYIKTVWGKGYRLG
ncbi:MAG: response regulator transcription factor [Oscillibacter sp.]|nr:response regulator transcription factor [Oscillibacter sp.]